MFNHLKLTIMKQYQVFAVTMSGKTSTSTWESIEAAENAFKRRKQDKHVYRHIYMIKITWNTVDMSMTDGEIIKEWTNDKQQEKYEKKSTKL